MTINDINKENMPQHIAIIMDGNRRWAKEKGIETKLGHKAGAESLNVGVATGIILYELNK